MASAALGRGGVMDEAVNPLAVEIARKYSMTPAQVGIYAVLALGVLPLVQTHNEAHMEENLKTVSFKMEKGDVAKLIKILLRQ